MTITPHLIQNNFGTRKKRIEFPSAGVYRIVFHTMAGNAVNCYGWFNRPNLPSNQKSSAHYGVWLTDKVEQYVDDMGKAYHAGQDWWNDISIGIEFEDGGNYKDSVRTPTLYENGAQLVAYLCKKYNIDINNKDNFALHRDILNGKVECPGGLDTNRIIKRAKEILNQEDPAMIAELQAKITSLEQHVQNLEAVVTAKEVKISELTNESALNAQALEVASEALKQATEANQTLQSHIEEYEGSVFYKLSVIFQKWIKSKRSE